MKGKLVRPELKATSSKSKKENILNDDLYIQVSIECYSVDFGLFRDDPNSGLWLKATDGVTWFKLHGKPHTSYYDVGCAALIKSLHFMNLYSIVYYGSFGSNYRRSLSNGR